LGRADFSLASSRETIDRKRQVTPKTKRIRKGKP